MGFEKMLNDNEIPNLASIPIRMTFGPPYGKKYKIGKIPDLANFR